MLLLGLGGSSLLRLEFLTEFLRQLNLDVDVAQLVGLSGSGRFAHEVGATVILGEGYDFSNGVALPDQHDHAVEAECQSSMGRCAEGECLCL